MNKVKVLIIAAVFIFCGCDNLVEPDIFNYGEVTYQTIEGGFWAIMPEKIVPYNLPENFRVEGLKVKYIYEQQLSKSQSTIQWGKQVKLTYIGKND